MAFEGGAKSVNPDAEVSYVYVGNWEDIGKGKELALAQINEGVDFIFPNADAAGLVPMKPLRFLINLKPPKKRKEWYTPSVRTEIKAIYLQL